MVLTRTDPVRADAAARRTRRLGPRSRRLACGLAVLAAGLLSGGDGYGYRFYWHRDDVRLRVSENATRWDSAAWGPRDTLRWLIANDPGWTTGWESVTPEGATRAEDPPFRRARDAAPFIAEALAAWSAIRSADIRWEVTGVEEGPGYGRDGRSMVTTLTDEDFGVEGAGAYATTWHERRGGPGPEWEFVECDVVLSSAAAAVLGSDDPANLAILIHELGHCIGLDHATAHSIWEGPPRHGERVGRNSQDVLRHRGH